MIRQHFICPGCGDPSWLCNGEAKVCDTCETKLTWQYLDGRFTLTAEGVQQYCEKVREEAKEKADAKK